jgi:GNAT superfamily N-acetyltransferase
MPVVCRPARAQDIAPAQELVVSSINDLTERHGFGQMAAVRPPHFQLFSLNDAPDGLWVAEEEDHLLGFAFAWTCGDLWFLAELFVSPGHQGRGIGNELMKRTSDHARTAGTTNKALITFAFNTVSQGLYIKQGLLPRQPLYFVKAAREPLSGRLRGATLRWVALEETPLHMRELARIDRQTLGVSREKHHRYLINAEAMRGVLLCAETNCVGYAYLSADGHIGPLAVTQTEAVGDAFRTALRLAVDNGGQQITAFLPGASEALSIAIEHGMRITFPMVLLSARDFGDWACYLPRNPGFM